MEKIKIKKISMISIMISLIIISIVFFRIPTIFCYIHIGDFFIYMSSIIGVSESFFIGSISTAISDIITGYPFMAIPSFFIHGLQGFLFSILYKNKIIKKSKLSIFLYSFFIGIFTIVFGYYVIEVFIYRSFYSPILTLFPNIVQVIISSLLTSIFFSYVKNLIKK